MNLDREKALNYGGWVLAGVLAILLAIATASDSGEIMNQSETKEVCVESHFEYKPAYSEGFPELDELNESFAFEKRNHTSVGGSVWYDVNATKVADASSLITYKRVEICDKKINKTVQTQ